MMSLMWLLVAFVGLFQVQCHGAEDSSIGKCHPSRASCSECYQKLVQSLLSSSENIFQLSKAFFPPRDNSPEFVTVRYYFGAIDSNETTSSVWFWSAYTSHFLHSPHTFQFLSLFFGTPEQFYTGTVNITLDEECVNVNEDTMEFLTQRVGAY